MTGNLTAERLRELLDYDAATGAFVWKVHLGRRYVKGMTAGGLNGHGYWLIRVDGRRYGAHRLAWLYVHGEWPSSFIDHRNCVRSDNRIENLRLADRVQNNANRGQSRSKSGLKGVWFVPNRARQWRAGIGLGDRTIHLGSFHTAKEAHAAYCQRARELFGEFARAR